MIGHAKPPDPPPRDPPTLPSVEAEVAALEKMTAAELCHRYFEEFKKAPRTRNRIWVFRALAFRVQEKRLGGLSYAARRRLNELMAEIEIPAEPAAFMRVPNGPRVGPRREPALVSSSRGGSLPDPRGTLRVGTVIVKTWHGRELRLTVREDGFELEGVVHRSMSAAARAVTGRHWNGTLFWFGRRKKP